MHVQTFRAKTKKKETTAKRSKILTQQTKTKAPAMINTMVAFFCLLEKNSSPVRHRSPTEKFQDKQNHMGDIFFAISALQRLLVWGRDEGV